MKGTKESILYQFFLLRKATISQLSEILSVSEISIRHHLIRLEAEGILTSTEERHGVGRPRFVYSLTEKGFQNAPTNPSKISDQALFTIKRFLGTDTLLQLFRQIGRDLARTYTSTLDAESQDEMLAQITDTLTKDGFIFSWAKSEEKYTLQIHHCPFHYLGQNHPEVCTINHALLESLIQHPLSHDTRILNGDLACTYTYEVQDGK